MTRRLNLLLVSSQLTARGLGRTAWRHLGELAHLEVLGLRTMIRALASKTASRLLNQRLAGFDYVIGHAELLLPLFRLRRMGLEVPFAIVPDFNHVESAALEALFLASQVAGPRDVLFTGSRAAARSFGAFGFATEPFYPLGIPLGYFTCARDRAALRARLGLPQHGPVLIQAGRLEEDKAVCELIGAFAGIRERTGATLLLPYHIWTEPYRRDCAALAERVGGVRLIERPTMAALRNLYRASDLYVSVAASRYETYGRAVVEAMACGAVPVIPGFAGFAETVEPGTGYLLPLAGPAHARTGDVGAFADTVIRLTDDPGAIALCAERARGALARHDSRVAMARLLEALTRRAALPAPPRTLPDTVTLAGYPEPIRRRMRGLQSLALDALDLDGSNAGDRIRVDAETERRFLAFWFEHY